MTRISTILIVDDDATARDTLEGLLFSQGYYLVLAENGPKALEKAAGLVPDVILLDVMMPGMDGFEVCRRLRTDPHSAEVPIIMVTALDDHESRLRGLEAGADDFISKPYDTQELRARIKTITRLNRYRRLLAERTRFKWVVDQALDGYVVIGDAGEMLYANPQAQSYLGLSEEGLIANQFLTVAAKRYRCEPQAAWENWPAAASDKAQRYLVQAESDTAQAFWLRVDVLTLPVEEASGRLIRLRDVTAQITLRKEIWGFHAAISHKLRTPLVVMLNSLELQARHMANLSEVDITELSEMALKSVNRLRQDVGDVLQYLNAPTLAKSGEGFSLARLELMVKEIAGYLGLKAVTVSIEDSLSQARIVLSERGIELALWEILENAKKFHPAQSPNVTVQVASPGPGQMALRVRDDGLTLTSEQLSLAWSPYYQGEKYLTGEVGGMGLGLAMVASLVWGVGGACRMYNREDGAGVVVEIVLPLAEGC